MLLVMPDDPLILEYRNPFSLERPLDALMNVEWLADGSAVLTDTPDTRSIRYTWLVGVALLLTAGIWFIVLTAVWLRIISGYGANLMHLAGGALLVVPGVSLIIHARRSNRPTQIVLARGQFQIERPGLRTWRRRSPLSKIRCVHVTLPALAIGGPPRAHVRLHLRWRLPVTLIRSRPHRECLWVRAVLEQAIRINSEAAAGTAGPTSGDAATQNQPVT